MKGQIFCEVELLDYTCKIYLIDSENTTFATSEVFKDKTIQIYLGVIGDFENLFESLLHELEEGYNWIGNTRFIPLDVNEKIQQEYCKFEYDHDFFQQRCSEISRIILQLHQPLFDAHNQLN